MWTREWLVVLVAMTCACDGAEIGERPTVDPPRSLSNGGNGGVAGPDAGTDADAGTGGNGGTGVGAGTGGNGGTGVGAGTGGNGGTGADAGTGTGGAGGGADRCAAGPLAAPIPNCDPVPAPSSGDIHADCVDRINQFRWECQCLPPLQRWVDGESCADGSAEYDSLNGVHASFRDMPCGSGARAQNECPGWTSTSHVIGGCLQSMWDEGPEDGDPSTVNGHYESMASTTYTRVACGFYTTPTGDVWGVQNFD